MVLKSSDAERVRPTSNPSFRSGHFSSPLCKDGSEILIEPKQTALTQFGRYLCYESN
jgi:hypothetical protein